MVLTEAQLIAQRARQKLRLETARLPEVYYYSSIGLCVLDAIYSIGVLYEGTEPVVKRYCAYFDVRRIRADRGNLPPKSSQEPLSLLAHRIDSMGPSDFAANVVRNAQRTSSRSGILKAEAVASFAKVLIAHGVEYLQDLPEYEEDGELVLALRGVHGQGSGISTGYFWMLAGNEDQIKPDRMILGFLDETLGRSVTIFQAKRLLPAAKDLLVLDYPHLTSRLLDYKVWEFGNSSVRMALLRAFLPARPLQSAL